MVNKNYKENRECWILKEFCRALKKDSLKEISVKCGEEGSGDGVLFINNKKNEVQIVSAERVLIEKSVLAQKNKVPVLYDVKPIEWIKEAIQIKVKKNYANAKDLIVLIDYSNLSRINNEYLQNELNTEEIKSMVGHFKEVYIISISCGNFIERGMPQTEPILVKL